ncbi:hypothetical protein [Methylobacterium indicum]|uniref:Uncharacterized protein n=1 Tax=Methylobacterium indicum TaxID=1775910 RepID=A0A8H8X142_9HYPH|nr:hypothetical protein [Methylobacterium indicum]BCM87883.1 hypothetical protein mvi_63440 [Methylobacterium indicum]
MNPVPVNVEHLVSVANRMNRKLQAFVDQPVTVAMQPAIERVLLDYCRELRALYGLELKPDVSIEVIDNEGRPYVTSRVEVVDKVEGSGDRQRLNDMYAALTREIEPQEA